jgi:D-methionine transport system ATP-binding protein
LFKGRPFSFEDKKALKRERKKLAMIFQHFHLLKSRNVKDNILLPLELEGEKVNVDQIIEQVGLKDKENFFIENLSGGEKQRVAIARALAMQPEVLFCDEATSSLDPKSTEEILSLLRDLNKNLGLTIILITHEMDVVRKICHKVAVMSKGQIIEMGSTVEIFSNPKQALTKELVQKSPHEDLQALKEKEKDSIFITLHFKGDRTGSPLISWMIQELKIEVNIVGGWMDRIEGVLVGSLTIAIKGAMSPSVFAFLDRHDMQYEVL